MQLDCVQTAFKAQGEVRQGEEGDSAGALGRMQEAVQRLGALGTTTLGQCFC